MAVVGQIGWISGLTRLQKRPSVRLGQWRKRRHALGLEPVRHDHAADAEGKAFVDFLGPGDIQEGLVVVYARITRTIGAGKRHRPEICPWTVRIEGGRAALPSRVHAATAVERERERVAVVQLLAPGQMRNHEIVFIALDSVGSDGDRATHTRKTLAVSHALRCPVFTNRAEQRSTDDELIADKGCNRRVVRHVDGVLRKGNARTRHGLVLGAVTVGEVPVGREGVSRHRQAHRYRCNGKPVEFAAHFSPP